jgi:hypothetical protein
MPVAAICGATFGLALEGLLDDRARQEALAGAVATLRTLSAALDDLQAGTGSTE